MGLVLVLVVVGTWLSRMLHDEIPSSIRAGVSSGVSTLTWLAFLPFAVVLGVVSASAGIHAAGWMVVAATVVLSVSLLRLAAGQRGGDVADEPSGHRSAAASATDVADVWTDVGPADDGAPAALLD